MELLSQAEQKLVLLPTAKKTIPLVRNLFVFLLLLTGWHTASQNLVGTVLSAASGDPLEGVRIYSQRSGNIYWTQDNGEFKLSETEFFPLRLIFSATGYRSEHLIVESASERIRVTLEPLAEALSTVVIRAANIPKELLYTPAAVSVISTEEIDRGAGSNVLGALNKVSGVLVHQGALNTNKLSIRGIGTRSQYSTDRVKVYFEGIPISSVEGISAFGDLPPLTVGRIEVLKGPASSSFGAGLGGVVLIQAREPKENGTSSRVHATLGSFGRSHLSTSLSHSSRSGYVAGIFDHLEVAGWRDNSRYDRKSLTLTGSQGKGGQPLSFIAQFTRQKAYIPSSLDRETLLEDPSAAAVSWKEARGYEAYDKSLVGISYQDSLGSNSTHRTAVHIHFRNAYEPRPFDILKEEQVAAGIRSNFLHRFDLRGKPVELGLGGELQHEWYDTALFANLYEEFPGQGSVRGTLLGSHDQKRYYWNLYGQLNFSVSEKILVETGVSLNTTRYALTDLYHKDQLDQTGSYTFDPVLSPRLGLTYIAGKGKTLYGLISHGFSTPSVAETLTPVGTINTDLKPESGVNYEIGFKGNFLRNQLYIELALFSIQVRNLLIAERTGPDQYIGRNAGRTDHNGVESYFSYNIMISEGISSTIDLRGNLNAFRFDEFRNEGEDFEGNHLPSVPRTTLQAGLNLRWDHGLVIHAAFEHQGRMPLNDQNSEFAAAYSLLDLEAVFSPDLFENWKPSIRVGAGNVLNEAYVASIVPNAVGFGGRSPRYFYPGLPRNLFAGFSLEYLF